MEFGSRTIITCPSFSTVCCFFNPELFLGGEGEDQVGKLVAPFKPSLVGTWGTGTAASCSVPSWLTGKGRGYLEKGGGAVRWDRFERGNCHHR